MNAYYEIKLMLKVMGPFLTTATNPHAYGVDKSFYRNRDGKLTIPASHIKGKLRMALEELVDVWPKVSQQEIDQWFGQPSGDEAGSYEPLPGKLRFHDMVEDEAPAGKSTAQRTRVTINPVTQTAAENLLRTVEDPIASGEVATFVGKIQFAASDAAEAKQIAEALRTALVWLPSLGAEKSVGFGRLYRAQVSDPKPASPAQKPLAFKAGNELHFQLTPQEPILVGGVKNRRSNFVESRLELSGGLIKGALAMALNEAFGVEPLSQKIDSEQAELYSGFENLARRFSDVRILHAFPAVKGAARPVRRPISAVKHGEKIYDVALSNQGIPMIEGNAPAYFIDWKGWEPYEGGAMPRRMYVTRTAIDDVSRRAAESQLFTYSFMEAVDEAGNEVAWIGNVSFANIPEEMEREAVKQEFIEAMRTLPLRLGKLRRPVDVTLNNGYATPALPSKDVIVDGTVLITLQTDAIMLEAEKVRKLKPHEDLEKLYNEFWREISGGALALEDFFAHQGFEGGYLYHRKLGAVERTAAPNRYRPYYLTRAGSVFKLKVQDEELAKDLLKRWLKTGLPWPEWAQKEYGGYQREFWENSPFVPENGYGEIVINLAWHWEKAI